jgi:hypothetical protein
MSPRFRRILPESSRAELEAMIADFFANGGTVRRIRDSGVTMVCRMCCWRQRVDGVISKLGIPCRRCGSRIR